MSITGKQLDPKTGGVCNDRPLFSTDLTNQLVCKTKSQQDELQSEYQSRKELESSSEDAKRNNLAKIPISAYLVVLHLTLERLTILGVMSILPLYLTSSLGFTERQGQMFYHGISAICYLAPILGGFIADKYIGRFRTIVLFDSVLILAYLFIPIFVYLVHLHATSILIGIILLNLVLVAVASGGVKACLSTFAADQLHHSKQHFAVEKEDTKAVKDTLFSTIYFCVNLGGFIGQLFLPTLRTLGSVNQTISTFTGNDSQSSFLGYHLAFSAAFVIFSVSFSIFVALERFYINVKPKGEILTQYLACLVHMVRYRLATLTTAKQSKSQHDVTNPYFLQPSFLHYTPDFVQGVRRTLGILTVLLPIPVFWALYEQQGSTWIFQANKMNGEIWNGWTVRPEQMLTLNVLSCLLAIPFMNVCVYPLLARINIFKTLNSRIVVGFLVASASFVCCAVVQYRLETRLCGRLPVGASQESSLVVYSLIGQPVRLRITTPVTQSVLLKGILSNEKIVTAARLKAGSNRVLLQIDRNTLHRKTGDGVQTERPFIRSIILRPNHETLVVLQSTFSNSEHQSQSFHLQQFYYSCRDIDVKFAQLYLTDSPRPGFNLTDAREESKYSFSHLHDQPISLRAGPFQIRNIDDMGRDKREHKQIHLNSTSINILHWSLRRQGGQSSPARMDWSLHEVFRGHRIHMAAQIPQICVMTFAEILICISAITFVYNEAPACMKTVVQALNQLTVFAGNGLVILVSAFNHRQHAKFPWWEMIFYAGMAIICSGIVYILGRRYEISRAAEEDAKTSKLTKSSKHFHRIQSEIVYPCWYSDESLYIIHRNGSLRVGESISRSKTSDGFFII